MVDNRKAVEAVRGRIDTGAGKWDEELSKNGGNVLKK